MATFNIGDQVRYTGTDAGIPTGSTGVIEDIDGFFPGSILAVNNAEGYVIGATAEDLELIEAAPTLDAIDELMSLMFGPAPDPFEVAPRDDLSVGDRVVINASGAGVSMFTEGTEGVYQGIDSENGFHHIVTDNGTSQWFDAKGIDKVSETTDSEPLSTPVAVDPVKVGDRVRLVGFTADTDGLEGTVTRLPETDEFYEVHVPERPLSFSKGYLLTRDEFEVIEEVAPAGGAAVVLVDEPAPAPEFDMAKTLAHLEDFETLARRLVFGAKAADEAGNAALANLLMDMSLGFASDTTDSTQKVIRILIGKEEGA